MKGLLVYGLILFSLPALVFANSGFGEYTKFEFAPVRDQAFEIPIVLEKESDVTVILHSPDGDPLRTLQSQHALPPGQQTLTWDGKDDQGIIVPNEAYIPVLYLEPTNGDKIIIDPRVISGGKIIDNLNVQTIASRDISYQLPAPARVLIRVGIKGGPMLRSLAVWEPRGPGKNIQRWDGRDSDGLIDITAHAGLGLLVRAFKLPQYSIVTTGNDTLDYRAYRQQKAWPERVIAPEDRILVRDGTRIAREYYDLASQYADPAVLLQLEGETSETATPQFKLGQTVSIRVDIPSQDRWLMNEEQYEVAFFLDGEFIAEEERGYVPITWNWRVSDISPGEHMLTVNISGFSGKVGVASTMIEILE